MLTYRYKLYSSKRNRKIDAMLREACFVWNHALALQKRYYRLFNGYIGLNTMQKHFAKRISRCRLHSQTVQEILERLDASYQRFFLHLSTRPPKFKRAEQFRSIVYKQGGFKLNSNVLVLNSTRRGHWPPERGSASGLPFSRRRWQGQESRRGRWRINWVWSTTQSGTGSSSMTCMSRTSSASLTSSDSGCVSGSGRRTSHGRKNQERGGIP